MTYIWQSEDFPQFHFNSNEIKSFVESFALKLGETNGLFQAVSADNKQEAFIEIMLAEAMKTSEIEGQYFSREDVMSSLKLNLGMKDFHKKSRNPKADAVAQLMIEIQNSTAKPLTAELLLSWHQTLMQTEKKINAGKWRSGKEPMQVISGQHGNITVHYEAPPSEMLPQMIANFLNWYQDFSVSNLGNVGEAMVFSALAHLYFETLHPFEDGNGRIGRALAEKALMERLNLPLFISISKAIEVNKKEYYHQLKKAQRNAEVTEWLVFCNVLHQALDNAKSVVTFTLKKANFYDRFNNDLNERELKAIGKMMEHGESGFAGGMTAKKYMSINKTSKATATRDLQHLTEIGVLIKTGAGRSVSYQLNLM